MLMHGFYDAFPGGHGWTTDPTGATGWEFSATPAYTFEANLDGQPARFARRERPQVVVGPAGELLHLFNGVEPTGGKHTFTMVTEVCQTGPPSWASGVPVCR